MGLASPSRSESSVIPSRGTPAPKAFRICTARSTDWINESYLSVWSNSVQHRKPAESTWHDTHLTTPAGDK